MIIPYCAGPRTDILDTAKKLGIPEMGQGESRRVTGEQLQFSQKMGKMGQEKSRRVPGEHFGDEVVQL